MSEWSAFEGEMMDSLRAKSPQYAAMLKGLAPAEAERTVAVADFENFLPPAGTQVGDLWALPDEKSFAFLQQLHPKVRHRLNIDGAGAHAVLQASSSERVRVLFRLHPQFEIAEKVYLSPAQFAGDMVYNTRTRTVESWELKVPQDHALNVSIEVHKDHWPVALGKVDNMGLKIKGQGGPAPAEWDSEVPRSQALASLKQKFYAFEAIPWPPLEQALESAKSQHKPVLAIVIAGSLDDQSC